MIFFQLTIAYVLDALFGDPYWLYHPVRVIGKMISIGEKVTRRIFPKSRDGQIAAGAVMAAFVVGLSFFIPALALYFCAKLSPALAFILETFWMYQILAGKCLQVEAKKVYRALCSGDIRKARKLLSYLVGRDTKKLGAEDITRAAVETVAENTTDGVIAPMIFMAIGGAPLGFAYKAINTMDSMVGYKNDKYRWFGKVPARLDDVANFIPARIAAVLMIISSVLCGYNGREAAKIFLRDRKKHLSPNSAQTESVCAGALGIMLGGTHNYFGKAVVKPTIGDGGKLVAAAHILDACLLMAMTSFLTVFILDMLRFCMTMAA